MMKVRFVLRDCDIYATIWRKADNKPAGSIFRGKLYPKEAAYRVMKNGVCIGEAATRGELHKLVNGTNWD